MKNKYWLASVDMGYGHQRAIYPLQHLAEDKIMDVASDTIATEQERKLWKKTLSIYEFFSRLSKTPIIGNYATKILNKVLYIPKFYPYRDLSEPTFQVKMLKMNIKKGLCQGMINKIRTQPLPLITSFYAPAIAADITDFEKVYCIICDTDLNRVWVAEDPVESRIEYFAPTSKVAIRLKQYGVPESKIHLTGFPLPIELLGDKSLSTLKKNLYSRIIRLDPENRFREINKHNLKKLLGEDSTDTSPNHNAITITFAVGGAGAQKEIAERIAISLKKHLTQGTVRLNLVAGTKTAVYKYFKHITSTILKNVPNIHIIYAEENAAYFDKFNKTLHHTDILWTKPSELSFYCALGIPIITSPAIGPQEKFNRKWLREIGAGIKQENPDYADQWMFDLLRSGRLAEAAWSGFTKARKLGTYKIEEVLETGKLVTEYHPLKR